MLLRIRVNNILSFGSETTFSLVPDVHLRTHLGHVVRVKQRKALRGAILFGPNAAGKSNLIKCVKLLCDMIDTNSCRIAADSQFALTSKKTLAMSWCVEYSFRDHVFKYMFSTDGRIVLSEKLFLLDDSDEELLFSRFHKRAVVRFGNRLMNESWYSQRTLTADSLLLRKFELDALSQQTDRMSGKNILCDAIEGIHSFNVIHSRSMLAPNVFNRLLNMSDFRTFLKQLMQQSDVGISDMRWQKVSPVKLRYAGFAWTPTESGIRIHNFKESFIALQLNHGRIVSAFEFRFSHGGYLMRADMESEGTLRLMHLSAFLYMMSLNEATWFVDELDCHLHPYISRELLRRALSLETKSQLIVTAHDTNLMTRKLWRTDEVWLVEKRMDGTSNMNTVKQLRGVLSKKLSYGYINGLYGAIPHVGGDMIR